MNLNGCSDDAASPRIFIPDFSVALCLCGESVHYLYYTGTRPAALRFKNLCPQRSQRKPMQRAQRKSSVHCFYYTGCAVRDDFFSVT